MHESLASMCRSGVPLPRAFEMLAADLRRGPLRDAARGLTQDLSDGVPFAAAYARHAESFPPAYSALISAGMAAGDLPSALAEIARHAERRARVSRCMRRALAAPLVSATFVLVVGTALLFFVAPRFEALGETIGAFSSIGDIYNGTTSTPVNSRLLAVGSALALLAVSVVGALLFAWRRSPLDGRSGVRALGLRWPVIGRLRLYAGLSGALSTLSALVQRGVPLPEALDLTASTAEEPALRANLLTMAAAAHDGVGLDQAARDAGLLPPSELWLLRAAQERGAPQEGLDDLASQYTERLDRTVARTASVVTPAAEIAIGIVVFVLAYTFVVPISEMSIRILGGF
jgi:type IV pilus assembly protein PilC